jgi:hypothetical protein
MEKVEVKFGEWIEEGFNLYKANFGPLVLASLLAILLSSVSFGILTGPMMARTGAGYPENSGPKAAPTFGRGGFQRL